VRDANFSSDAVRLIWSRQDGVQTATGAMQGEKRAGGDTRASQPLLALRQTLGLLTPRERRRSLLLVLVAVALALLETLGVASVLPFLAVLGNPHVIETTPVLAALYRYGGFARADDFLFALGVAALVVVIAASIFRAVAQYVIFRFVNMRRYSISMRLFDGYLGQPFIFFLNRNSADLVKRTLSDVDTIVDQCLMPAVQLVSYGIVAAALIALLVVVDPVVALAVIVVLGSFYAAIYLVSRRLLTRSGLDRNLANRQRFTEATHALGGIKEIKLLGREGSFAEKFQGPIRRYAQHKATNDTIALVPRYFVEAVAFGGTLAIALILLRTRQDLGAVLPILGLYGLAGYRLLPAVQQIYNGLTRLRFGLPMIQSVLEDLSEHLPGSALERNPTPLPFTRSIAFRGVGFRYPGAARPALDAVDFEISANTTVGIVGTTGAGKTTAIDLILGLLEPSDGCIQIDGVTLADSNRRAWQRNVGYVPQAIFLADATVAENIAFGVPAAEIDVLALERAARIANIHDVVLSQLPQGYQTEIGERGIRLSGGQRQRIGIARALYHDPAVLVFDEATSALDVATEAAVMEAISKLQHDKTIIIVAHRASTIEQCDVIFRVEAGTVTPEARPTLALPG
jgi:ATP-binding cassette, subfamily B, bacterial PglK